MVPSLSSFPEDGAVAFGVEPGDRVFSGLSPCVSSESFERLSRESIRACVSLLRGFPSDEPDDHWLPVLGVKVVDVLDEEALLGDSCFRSLSTTPSPKDTVLRLFEVVPGVTRMLFVGEAIVFPACPMSVFLAAVVFLASSAE